MANFPKTKPKIIIPTNKPFSIEYKGVKLNLEQDFYYEGGDIYIHIPAEIYRRGDDFGDDPILLDDRCQKDLSRLKWKELDADKILICDIVRDNMTGVFSIVPNATKTRMVQLQFDRKPFDLSHLCFQYADSYNAIDEDTGAFEFVRTECIKGVNNWLSGDYYQIIPTCEKWAHLRSYTGESMQDAVFQVQCQVDNPPKHIDLEEHLRSFDECFERNNQSEFVRSVKDSLRKAQVDYVAYHNEFVDRWLQM